MKKFILLLIIFISPLFSYNTKVTGAYAIGIFDAGGNGENIQHVKRTKADYNGTCFTKVFIVGKSFKTKPIVKIGNSIGHFQSSKPIFSKLKIKIGEVLIFKHNRVTKGLIQVIFKNKLYDSKVYVQ